MNTAAEMLATDAGTLPESPAWLGVAHCLAWVDVPTGTCLGLAPDEPHPHVRFTTGERTSCVVECTDGALLTCHADRITRRPAHDPQRANTTLVATVQHMVYGSVLNDGGADPSGVFFVGSAAAPGADTGSLYRLGPGGTTLERSGLGMANGMGWDPSGAVMYLVDSRRRVVLRAARQGDGTLDGFDTWLQISGGVPDGMTTDAAGNIWVAVWGAGQVRRYTSTGTLDSILTIGYRYPTSCCFGGPDAHALYITAAAVRGAGGGGNGSIQGAVFRATVDVPGLPATLVDASSLPAADDAFRLPADVSLSGPASKPNEGDKAS